MPSARSHKGTRKIYIHLYFSWWLLECWLKLCGNESYSVKLCKRYFGVSYFHACRLRARASLHSERRRKLKGFSWKAISSEVFLVLAFRSTKCSTWICEYFEWDKCVRIQAWKRRAMTHLHSQMFMHAENAPSCSVSVFESLFFRSHTRFWWNFFAEQIARQCAVSFPFKANTFIGTCILMGQQAQKHIAPF